MSADRRPTLKRFSWFWLTLALLGVNILGLGVLFILQPAVFQLLSTSVILLYLLFVGGGGAICLIAYSRSIQRRLLKPLSIVTEVTRNIADGIGAGQIELDRGAFTDVQLVSIAINKLALKAARDIDDMRRLERVRSEFVANVSHELRTPIFSVQGYLETLLDGAMDDPAVSKQFLHKAYSNALRLNTLLSDLIDISRIESGELRLSFRYFNVADLIKEVIHTLEIRAEQRNVTVYATGNGTEVLVYGDKERLTQVFTNLIDNAIKYNVHNGTVTVSATNQGTNVMVEVRDTGIGIPLEHQSRIFERFYRVDKDRSRAVGGTGLGLAIVKHILEAHHTTISVQSEVGVGTVISFALKAG